MKIAAIYQSSDKDLNVKTIQDKQDCGLQWLLTNRLGDALRRNWVKFYRKRGEGKFLAIPLKEEDRKAKLARDEKKAASLKSPSKPSSSRKEKHKEEVEKEDKEKEKAKDKEKEKEKEKEKDKNKEQEKEKEKEDGEKEKKKKSAKKRRQKIKYPDEFKKLLALKFDPELTELALLDTYGDAVAAARILKNEEATTELQLNRNIIKDKQHVLEEGLRGSFTAKKATKRLENFLEATNFLNRVGDYLNLRLRTCAIGCLICDGPLGYRGVKPTVCSNALCNHSFDNYGLGFNLMSEIKNRAELVDLLTCITCSAAVNRRHNNADVFIPYPDTVVDISTNPETGQDVIRDFHQENMPKIKDFEKVAKVINLIPSLPELSKLSDEKALRAHLDSIDKLCYPLLRWIMTSNAAHISLLPQDKHIKEMQTPYQFVLVSDNPEKEASFRRKRQKHGSFYAFHGSAIEEGCEITDKMSAGAAYGAGIYMAADSSTSFGYVRAGMTWKNSSMANDSNYKGQTPYVDPYGDYYDYGGQQDTSASHIACICLGEVIDKRKKLWGPVRHRGNIYVVKDESLVVTRYFFLYPNGAQGNGVYATADSLALPKDIYT